MNRLSLSQNEIKNNYEVVVIGSGYGGSITASRLSRAGRHVCILERGKELIPGEYPDTPVKLLNQVQSDFPHTHIGSKSALFDIRYNKDINVIVGCGLGGTSLINASINEPPDKRIYADKIWPKEIRNDAESGILDKFKVDADDMLKPVDYPHHYPQLNKQQAFEQVSQTIQDTYRTAKINVNFKDGINHVGVTQQACVNCGDCMTGCNYGAKNTLLMNYLPDAVNHGTEIFTEFEVDYIVKHDNKWRIHFHSNVKTSDSIKSIDTDIVVLAAGTLGSTEILLRSSEQGLSLSNKLGERFSSNGDMVGIAYNTDHPINAVGLGKKNQSVTKPVGPTSTAIIDTRPENNVEDGMVIASASIPGALGPFLPKSLSALAVLTGQNTNSGLINKVRKKLVS